MTRQVCRHLDLGNVDIVRVVLYQKGGCLVSFNDHISISQLHSLQIGRLRTILFLTCVNGLSGRLLVRARIVRVTIFKIIHSNSSHGTLELFVKSHFPSSIIHSFHPGASRVPRQDVVTSQTIVQLREPHSMTHTIQSKNMKAHRMQGCFYGRMAKRFLLEHSSCHFTRLIPRTAHRAMSSSADQLPATQFQEKLQSGSAIMEEVKAQSGRRYQLESILQDKEMPFGRVYLARYALGGSRSVAAF